MKQILNYLFEYKHLSRQQAAEVMMNIAAGTYSDAEIASFVTVFLMRSITIEELQGFKDALLQLALKVDLADHETMDIVGTGGDGKNTFNISTLSCFIVAGTGSKVAKHGNYGSTSVSGSSNVMEALGYQFKTDSVALNKDLVAANICFLHAPLFHPALKVVAPIRKSLAVRTFFNMLGPLVNPAKPSAKLIGVYNPEIGRIYNYMLQAEDANFSIIHSLDGYDEISLTGDTKVITSQGEKILSAEVLGKRTVSAADIYGGGSIQESAAIFTRILKGEGTWAQNAVVIANAAMALHTSRPALSYEAAYQMAVESLESGKAYQSLKNLIAAA